MYTKPIPMRHLLLYLSLLSITLNGQTINQLCPTETTDRTVINFTEYDGQIYGTGFFTQLCGASAQYVGEWDGSEWQVSTKSLPTPGHQMERINEQLYAATYVEGADSNWLYTFVDDRPVKVGGGVYLTSATNFSNLPHLYDVVEYRGDIIVCGEFDRVGSRMISGIMRWDGQQWQNMGGGVTDNIANAAPVIYPHQMLVHDDALYVAGNFRYAGGVEVNGIARWNGQTWSGLGTGFNSTVYGIGIYQDTLYAGGDFTASGDVLLGRIAKWTGEAWVSPGFAFESANNNDYTFVHTLYTRQDTLYIAGGLRRWRTPEGELQECGGIVQWHNGELNTLSGGVVNNDIEAVLHSPQGLLIGGAGAFGRGYVGILDVVNDVAHVHGDGPTPIVYPNPCYDHVHWNDLPSNTKVELLNALGQVLLTADSAQEHMSLTGLPVGYYNLRITGIDGSYVEPLLKQ